MDEDAASMEALPEELYDEDGSPCPSESSPTTRAVWERASAASGDFDEESVEDEVMSGSETSGSVHMNNPAQADRAAGVGPPPAEVLQRAARAEAVDIRSEVRQQVFNHHYHNQTTIQMRALKREYHRHVENHITHKHKHVDHNHFHVSVHMRVGCEHCLSSKKGGEV